MNTRSKTSSTLTNRHTALRLDQRTPSRNQNKAATPQVSHNTTEYDEDTFEVETVFSDEEIEIQSLPSVASSPHPSVVHSSNHVDKYKSSVNTHSRHKMKGNVIPAPDIYYSDIFGEDIAVVGGNAHPSNPSRLYNRIEDEI